MKLECKLTTVNGHTEEEYFLNDNMIDYETYYELLNKNEIKYIDECDCEDCQNCSCDDEYGSCNCEVCCNCEDDSEFDCCDDEEDTIVNILEDVEALLDLVDDIRLVNSRVDAFNILREFLEENIDGRYTSGFCDGVNSSVRKLEFFANNLNDTFRK